MTEQPHVRWRDETLILQIFVQVRLKAPPVDGEANKQLITLLAKQFNIPISKINLLNGKTALQKTVVAIEKPATIPNWLTSIKT